MNTPVYEIKGITCGKCVATIEGLLAGTKYTLHKTNAAPYANSIPETTSADDASQTSSLLTSWLLTYKPLLLLVGLITLCSAVLTWQIYGEWQFHEWMRLFMAAYFIAFAFFKLLDLTAFADAYAGYDLLAARWQGWGYVYPFIELLLGLAYLANWQPPATNWTVFLLMSFSAAGVILAVMDKRKIRCACIGAMFKLPMSTVTIIETVGMAAMAGMML